MSLEASLPRTPPARRSLPHCKRQLVTPVKRDLLDCLPAAIASNAIRVAGPRADSDLGRRRRRVTWRDLGALQRQATATRRSAAMVKSKDRATSSVAARRAVLKRIKDEGVEHVLFWFTDLEGHCKSFAITPSEMEGALNDGMGFDGSSITGFNAIEESDMVAIPDPADLPGHAARDRRARPPARREGRPSHLRRRQARRRPVRR